MKVNEIWLSSKNHQDQFNEIHKSNSWLRKIFGLYKIPSNFPFIRIFWQKLPIVYNNKCSLEIEDNRIVLKANHNFGFINRPKNMNSEYNQILLIDNISNIDRYENPDPFMKAFNINWICIKFNNGSTDEELMICVGGKLMTTVTRETDKVYESIGNKLNKV